MKELLEKLLSSELLTEEVKTELADAIQQTIAEQVEAQVTEQKEALVVEYATQFAADREALIEALDTKVEEMLQEQLAELAEDISNFRDLEVEFAAKLADEKASLAEAVEKDMEKLVERLDTFLELRLSEEVEELKESIEEVRKNNLGRKIFETFMGEFEQFSTADKGLDALQAKLDEAQAELAKRDELLAEAQKEVAASARKDKLETVLSSLQGRPREIMEAILVSVPTEKLEESYQKFIGRVLHESVTKNSEKESATPAVEAPVLAEGETLETKEDSLTEGTVTLTGDSEVQPEAAPAKVELSESAKNMMKLAGIKG
ncbi:hypothetical protein [Xanthomonas phage XacN1]|nr:hypothetical protein [Xanthomonas phage XacN1]